MTVSETLGLIACGALGATIVQAAMWLGRRVHVAIRRACGARR
jgi:hypothetical protein